VQCFHGYSLGFLAFLLRRWVGSGSASAVDWFPSMCASLLAFFLNLPLLSQLSASDSRFPKYPRLPVVRCSGYAPAEGKPSGAGGQE
jgi:hypothetical protein